MLKTAITTTLLGATILSAALTESRADMRNYWQQGAWTASAGVANDGSTAMCALRAKLTGNRDMYLKYDGKLFVQLIKSSWRIPRGAAIDMVIGFDDNAMPQTPGAGGTHTVPRIGVQFGAVDTTIPEADTEGFLHEFAEAKVMWIRFGGDEPIWSFSMEGSREASKAFRACMARIRPTTQPYTSQRPTQPFQQQTPTQPFNPAPKPVIQQRPNDRSA